MVYFQNPADVIPESLCDRSFTNPSGVVFRTMPFGNHPGRMLSEGAFQNPSWIVPQSFRIDDDLRWLQKLVAPGGVFQRIPGIILDGILGSILGVNSSVKNPESFMVLLGWSLDLSVMVRSWILQMKFQNRSWMLSKLKRLKVCWTIPEGFWNYPRRLQKPS